MGKLSVVMPVYNEAGVIVQVIQDFARVLQHFEEQEMIIVDDCSQDKTPIILGELQAIYPFLRVLRNEKNRGHGPTLVRAYRQATGDFVFHCDSDNQFKAEDFWLLWDELRNKDLDLVIGYRKERHDPVARLLLTRLVRFYLFLVLRHWLPDSNSPFRLYSRGALSRLLPVIKENSIVPSILLAFAAVSTKMRVNSLPVTHLPRRTGKSFLRSWKIFKLCAPAIKEIIVFRKLLTHRHPADSRDKPVSGPLGQWNNEMFLKHPTPYSGLAGYVERGRARAIVKEIKDRKRAENFTLLEIGCEAGRLLSILRRYFPSARFYGNDISTEALKAARQNLGSGVELEQADLADGRFSVNIPPPDFIVCSETLEHIPAINTAVANLKKIAHPDQLVIITVPYEKIKLAIKRGLNQLGIFGLLFKGIEQEFSEWHVNDFSKADLFRMFSDEFEILKYKQILFLHQLLVLRKKAT